MTLLEIEDLRTFYKTEDGDSHAVDGVNLSLDENETLGIVGESGSGKTTIARSIIRLLPDNGHIKSGQIKYRGEDILELSDKELRNRIRWKEISLIPQNAMNGFDPVHTVGSQIVQAIRTHEDVSKVKAWERTRTLFERLSLDPERVDDYPHMFSGGMAQRAMVALAIAVDPAVILADEPTTGLDVVTQNQLIRTLQDIQEEFGSSVVLITHDMSVVAEMCDKIAVVYGGRIVEYADTETVIRNPRHPYAMGLRNAFPDITQDDQDLISIPGTPPDLVEPEVGCRFTPRCPFATEECQTVTPMAESYGDGHLVECHHAHRANEFRRDAKQKTTWREVDDG